MNLKQINTFRAIMVTGSISSAAKLLFVSQPAISRLLAHTEQQLGYPLFERIKGRLYPTTEARILFDDVQTVYNGVARVTDLAIQLGEKKQGLLGIVSSPSIGHGLMPRCIYRFAQTYPGVRIRFRTLTYDSLVRSILDGESEIGVLFVPTNHPNLKSTHVGTIPMVCILPSEHPLAAHETVDVSALTDETIVSYRSGSPLSKVINEIFSSSEKQPNISIEVDAQQNVCDLVSQGIGLGIVDQTVAARQTGENLVMRPLSSHHSLELYLACSRYEPLSLLGRAFGNIVEEEAALL